MSQSTSGVAELIGRLKKDGVDAGEAEKRRVIEEAEQKAADIVADATAKAEQLLQSARQERERLKSQLDAELTMAARDFVLRFEARIKAQVIHPVVADPVKGVLEDAGFLKSTLRELCVRYAEGGADIELALSPETRKQLEGFFTGELKSALAGRDLTLVDESGLIGFRISKKGESFAWDFSKAAVAQELTQLVDPALRRYFALDDGEKGKSALNRNGQHVASA